MQRWLLCVVGCLLLWSVCADAACTGSGLTWNCPAGATTADVNAAISSASDTGVITFAAGAYTFTGVSLNARNGITLICATAGACTNNAASTVFGVSTDASAHKTNLMRMSGFAFTSTTGGNPTISLGYVAGDPWIDKLRIDHNTFNQTQGISIATGFTASVNRVNGVIDHNTFQGSTHNYPLMVFGAGDNDWGPSLQGTAENLFVEDNVFNYTTENLAASGMDSWQGGRMVVRYNTITNARVSVHGVCHNGPANLEIYNNTIQNTDTDGGFRIVHHQGAGEFMVFNNAISPATATMALQYYRSSNPNPEGCGTCDGTQGIDGNRSPTATYHGYPCYRQPGRTGNAVLRPVYLWNNRFSATGNVIPLNIEDAGGTVLIQFHLVADRDTYQAVSKNAQTSPTSPFNGTTGMGFGTLANRPTTCTPGPEASDAPNGGVGYFATDSGPQGTLYRCSTANTWTVHYQPYTYPHPLVGGVALAEAPTHIRYVIK